MDGGRITKRQYSEYSDFFFTQREPEYDQDKTYISGNPPKSDGADETGDVSRILVWGTPRTTGCGGHMIFYFFYFFHKMVAGGHFG